MKILVLHNFYQLPGGEDVVFEAEKSLLVTHGHQVVEYVRRNHEIANSGLRDKVKLGFGTIWASDTYKELQELISRYKPDIAHFHNTFPLISPSAYYACKDAGIPTVQSLHNPRLICLSANLYRNGQLCRDCFGKTVPWPGILHGCYRKSRVQTATVAAMLTFHRWLGTWQRHVDFFIVFTEFYRRMFLELGLPSEKILVKPHFISPDPGTSIGGRGSYALFVGRLDPEKGVRTLLNAWTSLPGIPLKIRGGGPLLDEVRSTIQKNQLHNIEIVGHLSKDKLTELVKGARFLVWPSEGCYETFGLVAIESFACGKPVIASRVGAMAEIVTDNKTGFHFTPGDATDLAAKIKWVWEHPEDTDAAGLRAREEFESKYSSEDNYVRLMNIYSQAIAQRGKGTPR